MDVKQVGRELGTRYLLGGSVRRAGNRVRITGQLVDACSGTHLWADRFEGELEDVFLVQDAVTSSVVSALLPRLQRAETERVRRKPTESLDAYDCYLRGTTRLHAWSRTRIDQALQLFYRSIELDSRFAVAHGMAAWCYVLRKARGWMADRVEESAEATRLAERAVRLGGDDAVALCLGGYTLGYIRGDLDEGVTLVDQALALNPNLAEAWRCSGWIHIWLGEAETAITRLAYATRLNPFGSLNQSGMAYAHFLAARYGEAFDWAKKEYPRNPNILTVTILAASGGLAERPHETEKVMTHLRQLYPEIRVASLKDLTPFRRPEDLARLAEGLRKAGLPD